MGLYTFQCTQQIRLTKIVVKNMKKEENEKNPCNRITYGMHNLERRSCLRFLFFFFFCVSANRLCSHFDEILMF